MLAIVILVVSIQIVQQLLCEPERDNTQLLQQFNKRYLMVA